jgi:Flp pilus assembly protein TadG
MEPTRRTHLLRLRDGARRPTTGPDHRDTEAPPSAAGRDRRRRRGGQSLVEFAVVLPVFLLILAGILDFGLGLYSQMTVINAAREGARLGIVDQKVADITARVDSMAAGLDKTQLTISVTCKHEDGSACSATWGSGDAVIVKVDYGYRMLWPLAFGNTLNLSSTVQMRIE